MVDPDSGGARVPLPKLVLWVLLDDKQPTNWFTQFMPRIVEHLSTSIELDQRLYHDSDVLLDAIGPCLPPGHAIAVQGLAYRAFRTCVERRRHPTRAAHGVFSVFGSSARESYDVPPAIPVCDQGPVAYLVFLSELFGADGGSIRAAMEHLEREADERRAEAERLAAYESTPARVEARLLDAKRRWREEAPARAAAARRLKRVARDRERAGGAAALEVSPFEGNWLLPRVVEARAAARRSGASARARRLTTVIASLRSLLIDTRQLDVIEPFFTIPLGEFSLPAISLAWRLTLAGYPATSVRGLHRTP